MHPDGDHWLGEIRRTLGREPRRPSFWQEMAVLKIVGPSWVRGDGLEQIYLLQKRIWREGKIVWGALVQANTKLYEVGREDLPADVVYSIGADLPITALLHVSEQVVALKGVAGRDSGAGEALSRHLEAEVTTAYGLEIPHGLSPDAPCALSTMMIVRRHIPGGKLSQSFFPLFLLNHRGQRLTTMVPQRYWPQAMVASWERL